MKNSLAVLCNNFIENRDIVKASFKWDSAYIYPVCAAIFTDKGKTADAVQMKKCKDILKEQTGVFSNFRSTARLVMVSMMAADNQPEEKLRKALQVYHMLKEHFYASPYLPVASMILAELAPSGRYEEIAAKTRHIYDLMKNEHPLLTAAEDSIFAALLALSNHSDERVVQETERCYSLLKSDFFSKNAIQSLSHVLALGEGSAEAKCQRVTELYQGLKERGCKYGTDYELATLGVLAMLSGRKEQIMDDMLEVDDFLAGQRGYGAFGIGKKQRAMHAGMLVTSDYLAQSDNVSMKSAAIGGTISLIAAQQAAMCAAIAASSAAAASAGSGN